MFIYNLLAINLLCILMRCVRHRCLAPSVSLDALELWRSSSRHMDHGGRDRQLCLFFSGTLNLHPISQFVSRFGNLFGFSLNTKIQILWVFVGEILRWSSLYFMREFVLRFWELQHYINKKQCSRHNQSVSQSL